MHCQCSLACYGLHWTPDTGKPYDGLTSGNEQLLIWCAESFGSGGQARIVFSADGVFNSKSIHVTDVEHPSLEAIYIHPSLKQL